MRKKFFLEKIKNENYDKIAFLIAADFNLSANLAYQFYKKLGKCFTEKSSNIVNKLDHSYYLWGSRTIFSSKEEKEVLSQYSIEGNEKAQLAKSIILNSVAFTLTLEPLSKDDRFLEILSENIEKEYSIFTQKMEAARQERKERENKEREEKQKEKSINKLNEIQQAFKREVANKFRELSLRSANKVDKEKLDHTIEMFIGLAWTAYIQNHHSQARQNLINFLVVRQTY